MSIHYLILRLFNPSLGCVLKFLFRYEMNKEFLPAMNRSLSRVCRICLKAARLLNTISVHKPLSEQHSDVKIQQALNFLVPELYLGVSSEPVICQDCKISLRIAYFFKKTCLETEQVVGDYLKKVCVTGQWINLADVIHFQKASKKLSDQDLVKDKANVGDKDKSEFTGKNLTFCEQSGLFVDENGCFFNAHGHPVDQSEMETEKANINERIDKLFEITSVFSLNEENGEPVDDPPLVSNIDKEHTDENKKIDPPPRQWIKIAPKEKLFGPKTIAQQLIKRVENTKKRNYVEVDFKEKTENGEVNKKMKILNEDILRKIEGLGKSPQKIIVKAKVVSTDASKLNQADPVETVEDDGPSRCLIDLPDKETTPLISNPQKTVCQKKPREKLRLKRKRDVEPSHKEDQSVPLTEDEDINEIIKNLHDDGTSQYVDVPEFIQIKQFSMSDLQVLQKDTSAEENDSPLPENSESNQKEKESDGVSIEKPTKPPEIVQNKVLKMPLPNVEKCKTYGNQNKVATKAKDGSTEKVSNIPSTSNFQKKFEESALPDTAKRTDLPKVNSCDTEKPIKKIVIGKSTITPKRLNKGNCGITRVNKNIERYTCDGTYIKDHDYLSNPYKLADILRREGDQLMSFCYICGSLDTLETHVEHMSGHKSFCKLCKKHYGNPFALNIHVKNHDRSCDWCDELVPYHKRHEHEKEHKNKLTDLLYEELQDADGYGTTGHSKCEMRTRSKTYVKYKEDSESTDENSNDTSSSEEDKSGDRLRKNRYSVRRQNEKSHDIHNTEETKHDEKSNDTDSEEAKGGDSLSRKCTSSSRMPSDRLRRKCTSASRMPTEKSNDTDSEEARSGDRLPRKSTSATRIASDRLRRKFTSASRMSNEKPNDTDSSEEAKSGDSLPKKPIVVSRRPNWTMEEIKLIKINFGSFIDRKVYPPNSLIEEFLKLHFMVRTTAVIKSKLQHLMRKRDQLSSTVIKENC